jgi:hypothetical protein
LFKTDERDYFTYRHGGVCRFPWEVHPVAEKEKKMVLDEVSFKTTLVFVHLPFS